jgi:type II secretory pathway pseudopilin PulG
MAKAKARGPADGSGFTLLETLIASTILTVGVGALAQLFVVSTQANRAARVTTFVSVLAQQKMEQLRGLTWGFDGVGVPVTDTTTNLSVVPEQPTGGPGLSPSPPGALNRNTPGYCDFLDTAGQPVAPTIPPAGLPVAMPSGATYARRWTVEPLPTNPNNTVILQVLVTTTRDRGSADLDTNVRRLPGEARLVSVKTRKMN